jgi:hypothetical protein
MARRSSRQTIATATATASARMTARDTRASVLDRYWIRAARPPCGQAARGGEEGGLAVGGPGVLVEQPGGCERQRPRVEVAAGESAPLEPAGGERAAGAEERVDDMRAGVAERAYRAPHEPQRQLAVVADLPGSVGAPVVGPPVQRVGVAAARGGQVGRRVKDAAGVIERPAAQDGDGPVRARGPPARVERELAPGGDRGHPRQPGLLARQLGDAGVLRAARGVKRRAADRLRVADPPGAGHPTGVRQQCSAGRLGDEAGGGGPGLPGRAAAEEHGGQARGVPRHAPGALGAVLDERQRLMAQPYVPGAEQLERGVGVGDGLTPGARARPTHGWGRRRRTARRRGRRSTAGWGAAPAAASCR